MILECDNSEKFKKVLHNLETISKNHDNFLSVNEQAIQNQLSNCKDLYDLARSFELEYIKTNAETKENEKLNFSSDCLKELLVEGFDEEQVWQQLEMVNSCWNEKILEKMRMMKIKINSGLEERGKKRLRNETNLKKDNYDVCSNKEKQGLEDMIYDDEDEEEEEEKLNEIFKKYEKEEKKLKEKKHIIGDGSEEQGLTEEEEEGEGEDDMNKKKKKKVEFSFEDDYDDGGLVEEDEDEEEEKNNDESYEAFKLFKNTLTGEKRTNKSELDDKFFKLEEMNKFLDLQDKKEGKKRLINKKEDGDKDEEEEEEEEDEINMFEEMESEEEEEEEKEVKEKSKIKYKDFFDEPQEDEKKEQINTKKTLKKKEEDNTEEEEKEDEEEEEEEKDTKQETRELIRDDQPLSSFEKRQKILKKKIMELEDKSIEEKPWQLKGEITGKNRPINSLIDEALNFDSAKPAPIITEQTSKSIEQLIIERFKSNIWDGPKRKLKVKFDDEFDVKMKKRKMMMKMFEGEGQDGEGKKSLSEVYEEEYLKNQQEEEEKLPEEVEEIKKSMEILFKKLDSLSNFHFTPKPSIPELEIITNLPAVAMEEVAPVATSNQMTFAPEEVSNKSKRPLVALSERTTTDKKRAHRLKKKKQHQKRIDKEKIYKIKKIKTEKREEMHKSKTDSNLKYKKKGLPKKLKKTKVII